LFLFWFLEPFIGSQEKNRDCAAEEASLAEIWTLVLTGDLREVENCVSVPQPANTPEILQDVSGLFTYAIFVAALGRDGVHLGNEGIFNMNLKFHFCNKDDLSMPSGTQVSEITKQTQFKPSTWVGREESLFQLCLCLEVLKTRELPMEPVESKCGMVELEVVI